jgi:hypothetical protein
MKAIVTHEFNGTADGDVYPRKWKAGDMVTGDLARVAVGMGHAEAVEDQAPVKKKDDVKPGSVSQQGQASAGTRSAPRKTRTRKGE